jgi:hypothetical protein
MNDNNAILISIMSVILYLGTDPFQGGLRHKHVIFIVNRGGISLVILVCIVDDLEGLDMLLESFDLRHIYHLWRVDLLGIHFFIVVVVLIEVLEYKWGSILSVTNILLYILDLLYQKELILLG